MFKRRNLLLTGTLLLSLFSTAQVRDTVSAGEVAVYGVEERPGSSYYWTLEGGELISGNGQAKVEVKWGAIPGLHHLQVTETSAQGCSGDPVMADVWLLLKPVALIKGPVAVCTGAMVTLYAYGGENYQWSGGISGPTLTFTAVKDTLIKVIAFGSGGTDTAAFHVKVVPYPVGDFTYSPASPIAGEPILFRGSSPHGNVTFSWEFDSAARIQQRKEVQYTYSTPGIQTVSMVVRNAQGCTDTIHHTINIGNERMVGSPSAFSPNGDGVNDLFRMNISERIVSFKYNIFNRWGEVIFTSEDRNIEWNGIFKGEPVDKGAFVLVFEGINEEGQRVDYKTTIAVTR